MEAIVQHMVAQLHNGLPFGTCINIFVLLLKIKEKSILSENCKKILEKVPYIYTLLRTLSIVIFSALHMLQIFAILKFASSTL